MGQGITYNTRYLADCDATQFMALAKQALKDHQLDWDEQHFYTYCKKGLVSPNWRYSQGLFYGDELCGFALVNHGVMPWDPHKGTAVVKFFYIDGRDVDANNTQILLTAVEDACMAHGIGSVRVSGDISEIDTILSLGYQQKEVIYEKSV